MNALMLDGPKIVEYGLKAIVVLLDLGFFLCCVLFLSGVVMEVRNYRRKGKMDGFWLFLIISIICGLISVVLSGLVLMPWWT